MAFTITIIFLTLLTFGKVQEINDISLKTLQNYKSDAPGIQSIKGHYIEESKKETKSVPLYDNLNSADSKSNKDFSNLNDMQNSNSSSTPKKKLSMKVNNSIVNVKSVMNSTIESLKKVFFFDSILLENNFNAEGDGNISDLIEAHIEDGTVQKESDIPKPHITFDEFDNENAEENNITRRILPNMLYQPFLPGIINTPLDYNLLRNKAQENMATQNKPQLSPEFHETKKPPCEDDKRRTIAEEPENENYVKNKLSNPAKGSDITEIVKTRMMMLKHPRVCYACSSIHDISCWSPNRKTTVKYCREDHHSCVSKLYKYKGLSYVMRDCDSSCSAAATASSSSSGAGTELAYNICSICHSDLCNRAHYLEAQNICIIMFILFNLYLYFNFYY